MAEESSANRGALHCRARWRSSSPPTGPPIYGRRKPLLHLPISVLLILGPWFEPRSASGHSCGLGSLTAGLDPISSSHCLIFSSAVVDLIRVIHGLHDEGSRPLELCVADVQERRIAAVFRSGNQWRKVREPPWICTQQDCRRAPATRENGRPYRRGSPPSPRGTGRATRAQPNSRRFCTEPARPAAGWWSLGVRL